MNDLFVSRKTAVKNNELTDIKQTLIIELKLEYFFSFEFGIFRKIIGSVNFLPS